MVWIHGGSLLNGANVYDEYGPQHFMDRWGLMDTPGPGLSLSRGVVLVMVNYRLGPLGFLSMATDQVRMEP